MALITSDRVLLRPPNRMPGRSRRRRLSTAGPAGRSVWFGGTTRPPHRHVPLFLLMAVLFVLFVLFVLSVLSVLSEEEGEN